MSLRAVTVFATLAAAVAFFPQDCMVQLTHADGLGWARTTESTTCSSIAGFTWSQSQGVSIAILVSVLLAVLVTTALVERASSGLALRRDHGRSNPDATRPT